MFVNIKTNKLENSDNGIKGLATVSFGEVFKVQSIAIMEGKNGLFVVMPSYKTNKTDEKGTPVYKEICNPITKEFRDKLYKAILGAYEMGREVCIGEAENRTVPNYGIKVTPIENGGNTIGIARVYLEDAFVISNIAIKKTDEGKTFISMPSFKTNQTDENGKPVYKDICYPTTKEFREKLQTDVIKAYVGTIAGFRVAGPEEDLPFVEGLQDPAKKKPEKSEISKADKPEKAKTIKERLAEGEAKKKELLANRAVEHKIQSKQPQLA